MKITFLFIAFFLLLKVNAQEFSYDWHTTGDITYYIDETEVVDTVVYSIITAYQPFDADPTAGVDMIVPDSTNGTSGYPNLIVLSKMSTNGTYLGSTLLMQHYSSGDINIRDMKISQDGRIVISGRTQNPGINFTPFISNTSLYSATMGYNNRTTFIAFYDLNGSYQNHIEYGDGQAVFINELDIDDNNNLYCTGSFSQNVDFDFTSGTDSFTANRGSGMIIKINLNTQSYVWTKAIYGNSSYQYASVGFVYTEIKNNKIYISGYASELDSVDTDPSSAAHWEVNGNFNTNNQEMTFIVKLDINGNFINSFSYSGTTDYADPAGIAVDQQDNVYVTGYYYSYDTLHLGQGASAPLLYTSLYDGSNYESLVYLFKLDNNLNVVWKENIYASESVDYGFTYSSQFIYTKNNKIAVCVDFEGDLLVEKDGVIDSLNAFADYYGISAIILDGANGSVLNHYDVYNNNANSGLYVRDFCVDDNFNAYIKGEFDQAIDFNIYDGVNQYDTAYTYGGPYMLTLKYCEDYLEEITVSACESYTSPAGNTYTSSGVYNESFTTANNCDSTYRINLTIDTIPSAVITFNNFVLEATAGGYSYQWINCSNNTPISGATNQSYTVTANGNYAVVVSNGLCSDTSACTAITNVGIKDINSLNAGIYPNPTTGFVNIETDEQIALVTIVDIQGKQLMRFSGNNKTIDISSLNNGVYFLQLTAESNKTSIHKIIKR
ncbi:MAG: T9SS type A sorting domain-containing protein [Chitinophagales bacterium]|nr:T9SS type A sorting domain-containing protein [Chitinophagales bacterium]